jgi:hypothetical protein
MFGQLIRKPKCSLTHVHINYFVSWVSNWWITSFTMWPTVELSTRHCNNQTSNRLHIAIASFIVTHCENTRSQNLFISKIWLQSLLCWWKSANCWQSWLINSVLQALISPSSLRSSLRFDPALRQLNAVQNSPPYSFVVYKKKTVALSAGELYRPIDRHLSETLVSNFADRGVLYSRSSGSSTAVISVSRPEPLIFLLRSSSVVLMRLSGPPSRPTTSHKIW